MSRAGASNVKEGQELASREEPTGSEEAWEPVRQGVAEWRGGKPSGLADAPQVPGRSAEEIVLEDRR